MTREEWNNLPSWGSFPCPDCGSYSTHPRAMCYCPPSPTGYGTRHINLNHHTCEPKKK